MFYGTSKKSHQSSEEFGLYKYKDCDDVYTKIQISKCGYVVVLLSAVIILSAVSYIISYSMPNNTLVGRTNATERKVPSNQNSATANRAVSTKQSRSLHLKSDMPARKSDVRAPKPFHYEMQGARPTAFRPGAQSANRDVQSYTHKFRAKNIQDIINYLSENHQSLMKGASGIKFSGIYQRPAQPEAKHRVPGHAHDPFRAFKPRHPSDVNLMATNNFRFAPTTNYETPKVNVPNHRPLNVVLDIFPMSSNDLYQHRQTKPPKVYPGRNHMSPTRHAIPRHTYTHFNPAANKNRMVVHLNLFPRHKSKYLPIEIPHARQVFGQGQATSQHKPAAHSYYVSETNDTERYLNSRAQSDSAVLRRVSNKSRGQILTDLPTNWQYQSVENNPNLKNHKKGTS